MNVLGDTTAENNERFWVYLQNPSGATVDVNGGYQGADIINDDDGATFGQTTGSAHALSVSGVWNETIASAGDQDWYSVNLVAGTTYGFDLWGGFGDFGNLNPYLRLLDNSGNQITFNDDSGMGGGSSRITYAATTTSTYYLSAQDATGTGIGGYVIRANVAGQDDYAGTMNTTALLSLAEGNNHDTTGMIETAGDQDWFRVYLTAGQQYVFGDGIGGALTTTLSLRDASGAVVASNATRDGNGDQLIPYTALASGIYYVAVQGTSGTGGYGLWTEMVNVDHSLRPTWPTGSKSRR